MKSRPVYGIRNENVTSCPIFSKQLGNLLELTNEECSALLLEIRFGGPGSEEAKERLTRGFMQLVYWYAAKVRFGISKDDRIAEGCLAIARSIERFDFNYNGPKRKEESGFKEYCNQAIERAMVRPKRCPSVVSLTDEDPDGHTLEMELHDDYEQGPFPSDLESIRALVSELSFLEQVVLRARGFDGTPERSYLAIANKWKTSVNRVMAIEQQAYRKLRVQLAPLAAGPE